MRVPSADHAGFRGEDEPRRVGVVGTEGEVGGRVEHLPRRRVAGDVHSRRLALRHRAPGDRAGIEGCEAGVVVGYPECARGRRRDAHELRRSLSWSCAWPFWSETRLCTRYERGPPPSCPSAYAAVLGASTPPPIVSTAATAAPTTTRRGTTPRTPRIDLSLVADDDAGTPGIRRKFARQPRASLGTSKYS